MIKRLSRYLNIQQEVDDLYKRIDAIGDIQGVRFDAVSVQSSEIPTLDKTTVERERLRKILNAKIVKSIEEQAYIEEYLDTIDDIDTRRILRYRYICGYHWDDIAKRMHMSRSTLFRKYKQWTRKHERD